MADRGARAEQEARTGRQGRRPRQGQQSWIPPGWSRKTPLERSGSGLCGLPERSGLCGLAERALWATGT